MLSVFVGYFLHYKDNNKKQTHQIIWRVFSKNNNYYFVLFIEYHKLSVHLSYTGLTLHRYTNMGTSYRQQDYH